MCLRRKWKRIILNRVRDILFSLTCSFSLFSGFALGQGTFQNLNFDSTTLTFNILPSVPIASALPGWTGYINGSLVTQITQNYNVQNNNIALVDSFLAVDGSSVLLNGSVSIDQNGTIPASDNYVCFSIYGAPLTVSFAGSTLPTSQFASYVDANGQTVMIYDANISAWAGETGQLMFAPLGPNNSTLDNIIFSPNTSRIRARAEFTSFDGCWRSRFGYGRLR
jgi:hypothetical protein